MRFECKKCKQMSQKIAERMHIDINQVNKPLPEGFYERLIEIRKFDWFDSFNRVFNYSEAVIFLRKHIGHTVYFMNV